MRRPLNFGYMYKKGGAKYPFVLNFDVIFGIIDVLEISAAGQIKKPRIIYMRRNYMFKKITSVALALVLVFAAAAIAFAADSAPAPTAADSVISFDTTTTGWTNFSYVSFHIWNTDGTMYHDWGGKKQRGTDAGDGIWTYDLTKLGIEFDDAAQYAVIFYTDLGQQTYNLLFDTTCFGDTAYADTSQVFENPEDSQKSALPAYWKNQDPAVNGPELKITSIGNVVGSCCPRNTTPEAMLADFLKNTLPNAREFSGLSDQEIIDNAGAGLGLSADDVQSIIAETGVEADWSYEDSKLDKEIGEPTEPETEPTVAPGPEPGEGSYWLRVNVDVAEGEGTVEGGLSYEISNGCAPEIPEPVILTATPAEGWRFNAWSISGEFEYMDNCGPCDAVITLHIFGNVSAHATFLPVDYVRGDADGDGLVTIMDATRIQRYKADLIDEAGLDMLAADADGDGEITILDATRIQRVVAELCEIDGTPLSDEPDDPAPATPDEPAPAEPTEGSIDEVIAPGDEYELPLI